MIYKMKLADSVDEMTFDLLEVPIEDKDIEGTADNTTIDGNVFTDYLWLKKQFVQKWSLMCEDDYTQLRGFYTRQWENAEVPTYKLFYGENVSSADTATGDIISLTNSTDYDAPVLDFEMQGNAEQTTYTGKNLINLKPYYFGYYYGNSVGTAINYDITTNADKTSYTANADGTSSVVATASWRGVILMSDALTTGTYYFNVDGVSTTANQGASVYVLDNNHIITRQVVNLTGNPITNQLKMAITLENSETYIALGVGCRTTAGTVNIGTFMISQGSTPTAYEPYVGGIASPNPDYPQAVNTTTGENVVKITGKNLFDKNNYSSTAGYFYSSDTLIATGSATHNILFWISCVANTKYSITIPTGYGIITKVATSLVKPANGVSVAGSYRTELTTVNGFTTSANAKYLVIYLQAPNYTIADILDDIVSQLQIEFGSTATTYEPYQGQDYEVNLGKNLMPIIDGVASGYGITATVEDGVITLNGTTTSGVFIKVSNGVAISTANEPSWRDGTIVDNLNGKTISIEYLGGSFPSSGTAWRIFPNSATYLYQWYPQNSDRVQTFTTNTAETKVFALYANGGLTFDNYKVQIQLEKGSTATAYTPYFTPIELAKIGTYQDRIYKNDGKWYIEKQTGKVVVDATNVNNWALNNTTYAIPMMRTDKNILGIPVSWDSGIVLMNRYSETTSTNNIYSGAFTTNFQKGYLTTFNNAFTDEETGRNILIGTEIYYALATPITTEITEQALIDQLDAIVSAYLPRGAVNISLTGTGAQGSMVLDYKLIISKETIIKDTTPVRLTLTDGGVINPCGCRQNIQLIMRETVQ